MSEFLNVTNKKYYSDVLDNLKGGGLHAGQSKSRHNKDKWVKSSSEDVLPAIRYLIEVVFFLHFLYQARSGDYYKYISLKNYINIIYEVAVY